MPLDALIDVQQTIRSTDTGIEHAIDDLNVLHPLGMVGDLSTVSADHVLARVKHAWQPQMLSYCDRIIERLLPYPCARQARRTVAQLSLDIGNLLGLLTSPMDQRRYLDATAEQFKRVTHTARRLSNHGQHVNMQWVGRILNHHIDALDEHAIRALGQGLLFSKSLRGDARLLTLLNNRLQAKIDRQLMRDILPTMQLMGSTWSQDFLLITQQLEHHAMPRLLLTHMTHRLGETSVHDLLRAAVRLLAPQDLTSLRQVLSNADPTHTLSTSEPFRDLAARHPEGKQLTMLIQALEQILPISMRSRAVLTPMT